MVDRVFLMNHAATESRHTPILLSILCLLFLLVATFAPWFHDEAYPDFLTSENQLHSFARYKLMNHRVLFGKVDVGVDFPTFLLMLILGFAGLVVMLQGLRVVRCHKAFIFSLLILPASGLVLWVSQMREHFVSPTFVPFLCLVAVIGLIVSTLLMRARESRR